MKRVFIFAFILSTLVAPGFGAQSILQRAQVIPLPGVEGRIDHLAVDVDAKRLYVAALGNNTLEVIDLAEAKRVQSIDGLKEPQGVGVVQSTGDVLVATGQEGKCRIFDRSLELLAMIDDLDDADNVRIDASGRRAFVGYGGGAIAVIDLAKRSLIGRIELSGHPESFQLESRAERIFVNVPSAKQIAAIDREKQSVVSAWPANQAASNFPMALDEVNRRLMVGCRKPAKLLVFDIDSGRCTTSVDCAGDADDVFYDVANRRVYVSGGDGTISVFSQRGADDYALIETVKSAQGARTSLFVPAMKKFFLAIPHRGSQEAAIWVYSVAA